jgi:hypothetical protein
MSDESEVGMTNAPTLVLIFALSLAAACARDAWQTRESPISPQRMQQELGLQRDPLELDPVPEVREPEHLRPCCAFGSDVEVRLGPVPVFGYEIYNTLGPSELGEHEYDGGSVLKGKVTLDSLTTDEANGLVFTCRAGFVDLAHLREWADYTLYLSTWIMRHLEAGGTLPVRYEGGGRRIVMRPTPPELLESYTVRELSVPLAQWLAFEMSVWHEIATWYGWASLGLFPELASAFSPEDLYSNILGIKLSGALIYDRKTTTEGTYNDAMTAGIPLVLGMLGAQEGELGHLAAMHVDGVWWDSGAKLPSKNLVLRRNLDAAGQIEPWRLDDVGGDAPAVLQEACRSAEQHSLPHDQSFAGIPFRERATLEIEPNERLIDAAVLPPDGDRRVLTQDDFPRIIEAIRAENALEFGPGADTPYRTATEARMP